MLEKMKQLLFFGKKILSTIGTFSNFLGMFDPPAIFVILLKLSDSDEQELLDEMKQLIHKGYRPQINNDLVLKSFCQEKAQALLASGPPEWSMPSWIVLIGS